MLAPPKQKRFGFFAIGVAGAIGLLGGAAVFAGGGAAPTATPAPSPTVTVTVQAEGPDAVPEPAEEPTEEAEPATYSPKKSDWKVNVKETGKHCFGSAGCNVELGIEPEFAGDASTLPDSGTIEVTFEITGAEDPLIDTFTVEGKQISWTKEQSVSTSSKGKSLKAKVTAVDYNTY